MKSSRFMHGNYYNWRIQHLFWISISLGTFVFLWYLSFKPGFEGHHENANAMVLISLDQWLSQGPLASYLAPALSYPGKNNAFIASSGVRLFNDTGTGFYTSAGAYSIMLPYLILQIPAFSLSPQTLIHLLSLINVLAAAILLFTLVRQHTTSLVARYATIYFLFQPLVSQLSSHLWSWDSGWLVPWLVLLVLTSSSSERPNPTKSGLVFVTSLLAVCNDHQGIALVTMHIVSMLFFRRAWFMIIPTALGLIAAVLITEVSYAQIAGLPALLTSQQGRFASRMIGGGDEVRLDILLYSAALVAVPLLACLPYGKSDLPATKPPSTITMLIVSSLGGSLLDFMLFPQWHEAHYFSLLKFTIPFTLVASLWMEQVSLSRSYVRRALLIVVLTVSNTLTLVTREGSSPQTNRKLGILLREIAPAHHALAAITPAPLWAPVVYNAKRNIMQVSSTDEFMEWMKSYDIEEGTILTFDSEGILRDKEVISPSKLLGD